MGNSEKEKQDVRELRQKLDAQIDFFNLIHQYAQETLCSSSLSEMMDTTAEGVVDIFQVELGVILILNVAGDKLIITGSCNYDDNLTEILVSEDWIKGSNLLNFKHSTVTVETPTEDSPLAAFELAHAMYYPIFDNNHKLEGIILGGISKAKARIFDYEQKDVVSSFAVYCQQMNGIINNFYALETALEAVKVKKRFLSNLNHEIRTPLNAIIGMNRIAMNSQKSDEIARCAAQIDVSSRQLLGLLNDALDISQIEDGKLALENAPFALNDVLYEMITAQTEHAAKKDISITLQTDAADNLKIVGDSPRLIQALTNIVSNAVKFSNPNSGVTVDVRVVSRDSQAVFVKFAVIDQGIGMSDETLSGIFSSFVQADDSMSKKYGGMGLGLSISKNIVELMGGTIQVKSAVGAGTTVSFDIWFERDASDTASDSGIVATESIDFSRKHILVVDDVEINREIVAAILEDSGATLSFAENGTVALEMFAASENGCFDLILMDIQMPIMDGMEATRAIRALDREDATSVPILALTANVSKHDVQNVINAGMNGHIGKPIEYESAMSLIGQFIK
ncbi:MAG: response regulator [Oscillospiraceae bacterium]|nr:response regulator [Oscillospiraceae bacterium]